MKKLAYILNKIAKKKKLAGIFFCKANEGYSAVLIPKKLYSQSLLLKNHINGESIVDILNILDEGEDLK